MEESGLYVIRPPEEQKIFPDWSFQETLPYWKNWKKNGAFATRAGGARNFYLEAEEIADNFTEGDEFPEERAGGARETEVRAGGAREAEGVADNSDEETREVRAREAEGVAGNSDEETRKSRRFSRTGRFEK